MLSIDEQAPACKQVPDRRGERNLLVCSRTDTRPAWLIKAQSNRGNDRRVPAHQNPIYAIANARIAGSQKGAMTHARRIE
ncbi:hypothetical protein [Mesorhizobium silamurunense]|uniref:hypothetical protein n=1 Tax=Mesorhizobium silamurunense TaxID=499528 RepID=UPI00177D8B6B|nr:hypothetical protein [Mesorhizobium silamurunense]